MSMRILVAAVVLAVAPSSGCVPSNAPSNTNPPQQQAQPAGNVAAEEQYPRLKWKWIEAGGNETLSTGSPISASDASFRVVEDKLRQLDWKNAASKPSLAIELAKDRSLTIMLSPDANGDQMIAVVRKPGPKYGNTTSMIVRQSRPLKDSEQALALLRSYAKDNEEFESLVEWVDQSADSSTKGD